MSKKYEKIKALNIGMSILRGNTYINCNYLISHSLTPKIETCLKYFSDKNIQKQPLCFGREFKEQGVKTNPVD